MVLLVGCISHVLVIALRHEALDPSDGLPRLVSLMLGLLREEEVPLLGEGTPGVVAAPCLPCRVGLRLL